MVLTQARYFLRLESGERVGETIPIPATGLTVGRRPDNGLQIAEPSVSGHHAELQVDAGGVTLRDLGSTNGTRVGAEKITEQRLVHGDDVEFGHVKASFVDEKMLDPAARDAAAASGAAAAGDAGEAVHTVGADRMASTGKRGMLGLLLLVVVVGGAGAGAFFYLRSGGEQGGGAKTLPVVDVPGNLVADASFEGMEDSWEASDAAPASFYRAAAFRRTGEAGLGADVMPGEWARASSPAVRFRARKGLALSATLDVAGDAEACVGVELNSSTGDPAPFVAWTRTLSDPNDDDGFEEVTLLVPSLPGYDGARIVVEARGTGPEGGPGGTLMLDDVALVEAESPGAAAKVEDDALFVLGEPGRTAVLAHATEVVVSGLRVRESDGAAGPRWSAGTLSAAATPNGMHLDLGGLSSGAMLAFTAHLGEPPFLATIGPEGFHAYGASFADARATSLLFGGGSRILRLGFASEVVMSATLAPGGLRVEVALPGSTETVGVDLQVSFREERNEAYSLATKARELARKDAGAGLAAWTRILDEYPFETRLVEEAEQARTRLLQSGHQELEALRADYERARFFGLADLFRRCGDQTRGLAKRYAGSEIEPEALALAEAIDAERAQLEASRREFERERLEAILGVVEGERWQGLAERVRAALERP